jgi:hypothetical protein
MPDDLTKFTIPLFTFFAGVIATLAVKRFELRRAALREHVQGVVAGTRDWYNQLQELHGALIRDERRSAESREAQLLVFSYLHSRFALPGLQFHLDALKRLPGTAKLIAEANAFLAIVTASREAQQGKQGGMSVLCVPHIFGEGFGPNPAVLKEHLGKLDEFLQRVAHAGASLMN